MSSDNACLLETGYYLNPREPCETYSQFGRLPALNTEGWSVLCVSPGRLSDAFAVSSELEEMTTMFVDKTVKYDLFLLLQTRDVCGVRIWHCGQAVT